MTNSDINRANDTTPEQPTNYFDIPSMTAEDFNTDAPYIYIYSLRENPYDQEREYSRLLDKAKELKVTGIRGRYNAFAAQTERNNRQLLDAHSLTSFKNPPNDLTLISGRWEASEYGIYKSLASGELVFACAHPIMPVERYTNIDTKAEKLRLAFKRGGQWRDHVVVDMSTIASPQKITALADQGISVTSENARALIEYLQDVSNLNYNDLPNIRSANRMGWVNGGTEFLPYCGDIFFDGEAEFQQIHNAIQPTGDLDEWINVARDALRIDISVRVALAASFASPLLKLVNGLPAFVHMWSSDSGTGKTVIAMLAASVWGDPEMGRYTQSFNSTDVADEMMAGFLNSLPLVMDELQVAKDRYGNLRFNPYKIAQGTGKRRGRKTGGVQDTLSWKLFCITTGESPLTTFSSGAGAVARVIDIEMKDQVVDLMNGQRIVASINDNYGHAGKEYIEHIKKLDQDELIKRYHKHIQEIHKRKPSIQSKQAGTGAVLVLASEIANEVLFKDEETLLTPTELLPYLLDGASVALHERAHAYITEWVAIHSNKFYANNVAPIGNECFGEIDGDIAYIIRAQFKKILEEGKFDERAVLSSLAKNKLILTKQTPEALRMDRRRRIGGQQVRCIAVKMSESEYLEGEQETCLPMP